jgi:4-hydroxybenzoate polyprenyltransferase
MRTTLLIALIILFLGPWRRPFLRHWRVTVPMALGLGLGLGIAGYVALKAGLSPLMTILLAISIAGSLAVSFGEVCKDWFDRYLPKKE